MTLLSVGFMGSIKGRARDFNSIIKKRNMGARGNWSVLGVLLLLS